MDLLGVLQNIQANVFVFLLAEKSEKNKQNCKTSNFQKIRVSDPNPVFLPGSGFGFQISLDPDPVSAPGSRSKKKCRRGSKSCLLKN